MRKEKKLISHILKNNLYAVKLVFYLSRTRVLFSVIKQIVEYFLWVFYSAFFVRFVMNSIENERPLNEILYAIGIIGGSSLLLKIFSHYCDDIIFPMLNIKVYRGMYQQIYTKSENVELQCYEKSEFYNKFSMALDDMGTKICEVVDNMSEVIGGTIGGILACYTMIEIDLWTIVFLIAPLIGNFVFSPKMNVIHYNRYLDTVPSERKMSYVNRIIYLPDYVKEFRLSNVYNVIRRQYNEAVEKKASIWKKYFKEVFALGICQYIFSYMIIFEGILLYGAYRAIVPQRNMISFSQMATLTSVMVTASWIWVCVINAINSGTKNSLLVSNLKQFLEYKEKIPENQDGISPDREISSIEFKDVTFSYDGQKDVIRCLSFKIEGKSSLVLVGHNGAGKTTIIKLLLRMYDPTSGEIFVNGRNIREYNLREYRQLFSCAFQDGVILPGTVKHNIVMGRHCDETTVISALKQVGIYEKISKLPKGLETPLTKEFDDEGVLLSGGEYQKILVARALANNSPIVVFDEPSSALDPISENELFTSILNETKKRVGILISHRLSCVKDADYVLMLEKGQIIERGTHNSLLAEDGKYAEMYHIQEKNYFAFDKESVGESI